jgi:hypothetical protein
MYKIIGNRVRVITRTLAELLRVPSAIKRLQKEALAFPLLLLFYNRAMQNLHNIFSARVNYINCPMVITRTV